jgi:hypothetical protein
MARTSGTYDMAMTLPNGGNEFGLMGREMTTTVLVSADALARLATDVRRLSPDWQRPERFYERRSDIVGKLRSLSRGAARDIGPKPYRSVPPRVAVKPQPPPRWLVPQPCRCRHRRRRQPDPRQLSVRVLQLSEKSRGRIRSPLPESVGWSGERQRDNTTFAGSCQRFRPMRGRRQRILPAATVQFLQLEVVNVSRVPMVDRQDAETNHRQQG